MSRATPISNNGTTIDVPENVPDSLSESTLINDKDNSITSRDESNTSDLLNAIRDALYRDQKRNQQ